MYLLGISFLKIFAYTILFSCQVMWWKCQLKIGILIFKCLSFFYRPYVSSVFKHFGLSCWATFSKGPLYETCQLNMYLLEKTINSVVNNNYNL